MKAICIDSSNKPEGISELEWIEEGEVYTITEVVEMGLQNNKLGIALAEVELTSASAPYKYYSLERFLLVPNNMDLKMSTKQLESKEEEKEEEKMFGAEDADLTNSI